MLNHVYRQDISTIVHDSLKKTQNKPNKTNGHSKLIKPTSKFLLANIYDHINKQHFESNEIIDGLKNLISCLDVYFDMEPTANRKSINKHTELQFFETAGLCSDEYIRCTEQFYSEPMSSNTMICMNEDDNGNCCGNVLLLFKFTNSNYLNEDLALIQWYDFKYIDDPKRFYKYECPYLKLTKSYNIC
nr:7947_t:CDS:2 [Entrophospora candida]